MNNRNVGVLISLGKALFGESVGVPYYEDVINGVVHVKVEAGKQFIREDGSTGQYNAIFHFDAVSADVLDLVRASGLPTIEQYSVVLQ